MSVALPADGGAVVGIPSQDGKSIVLDFWGPTREPCRKKLPELVAKNAELQARGGRPGEVGGPIGFMPRSTAMKAISGRRSLARRASASAMRASANRNQGISIDGLPCGTRTQEAEML